MYGGPVVEVEQKRRMGPGALLVGLTAAVLLGSMLGANVRLYELRQENQALEERIQEQQEALRELKRQAAELPDMAHRARELGLRPLEPEQVEVLHIRGGEKE